MKIAVLGCGPAGLMAADQANQLGHYVTIYSRKQPSVISGAQYLHQCMGWYTHRDPDFIIKVQRMGTRDAYARRVYGDPNHEVSWDQFPDGELEGWDIRDAYQKLWMTWHEKIIDSEISKMKIENILIRSDRVFLSLPLHVICQRPNIHQFNYQTVKIRTELKEGKYLDCMVYNGMDDEGPDWYRYSMVGNYASWEYPESAEVEGQHSLIRKPLATSCDCYPDIVRVGRFGTWTKGVLTHHAVEEVDRALQQVL